MAAGARQAEGLNLQVEGLRGLAILLVVVYHLELPVLSGGFVGVDVFFVLSGYLIPGLLVRECDRTGTVDLVTFWVRRLRRLLPANIVVVAATVAAGAQLLPPERFDSLLTTAGAALTYTANLRFIAWSVDYYAALAVLDPLLHMWSLGVEAQFYLGWPLLIMAVAGRYRAAAMVVLAAASLGLCVYLTPIDQPMAFYGLPTRLWELAVGGLLACARFAGPAWLGYAGLAAVGVASLTYTAETTFPGVAALLPVLGTAACVSAAPAWLGSRPLAWVGQRSYSWYLWHWPLILFSEMVLPGAATRTAAAVVALIVSDVSFRYVEQPLRARRTLP